MKACRGKLRKAKAQETYRVTRKLCTNILEGRGRPRTEKDHYQVKRGIAENVEMAEVL